MKVFYQELPTKFDVDFIIKTPEPNLFPVHIIKWIIFRWTSRCLDEIITDFFNNFKGTFSLSNENLYCNITKFLFEREKEQKIAMEQNNTNKMLSVNFEVFGKVQGLL